MDVQRRGVTVLCARAGLAMLGLVLAACSKTPFEQKEAAFRDAYDKAESDLLVLEVYSEASSHWINRAAAALNARQSVSAAREYRDLALKGAAGTTEQLIAARREIYNPGALEHQEALARAHGDPSDALRNAQEAADDFVRSAQRALETWLTPLHEASQDLQRQAQSDFSAALAGNGEFPKWSWKTKDYSRKVDRLYISATSAVRLAEQERAKADQAAAATKTAKSSSKPAKPPEQP